MFEELIKKVDNKIKKDDLFKEIDEIEEFYSQKIINTFKEYMVSETDFHGTTGYGYNDTGRDKIDMIFAKVLILIIASQPKPIYLWDIYAKKIL